MNEMKSRDKFTKKKEKSNYFYKKTASREMRPRLVV